MLREKVLDEYDSILNQINQIQCEISKLPKGKLIICHDGKYKKWYVSDGHKRDKKAAAKAA